jgi:hypothetical protein
MNSFRKKGRGPVSSSRGKSLKFPVRPRDDAKLGRLVEAASFVHSPSSCSAASAPAAGLGPAASITLPTLAARAGFLLTVATVFALVPGAEAAFATASSGLVAPAISSRPLLAAGPMLGGLLATLASGFCCAFRIIGEIAAGSLAAFAGDFALLKLRP